MSKKIFGSILILGFILLVIVYIVRVSNDKGNIKDDSLAENPKLVVGIVVDQMKYQYLTKFWNHYSNKGFKQLINKGFIAKNNHYGYAQTSTGPGHTTVATGTYPSVHGIIGISWYNKNIKKSIKEKTIVNDISFDVPLGAINGLLGPNGAGKTTTFYIIAGLMKCDQGKVIFNNVDISKLSMHKRSKLGIKYLPQEPSIFLNLSVYENLLGLAEISIPKKQDIDIFIEKSIDEFNLSKILDLKGRQLSGGQRRKVEIARTLAAKPEIILLDEPFAGIDPIAIDEIKQVLIKLKQKNIGILITDHNVREALEICDQAMVISNGAVIASGNKSSLINNELVKKVYLGNMYK